MSGVAAELDGYEQVVNLIEGQPAFQRLEAFAEVYVMRPDDELGQTLHENPANREKVETAVSLAWRTGVTLALL